MAGYFDKTVVRNRVQALGFADISDESIHGNTVTVSYIKVTEKNLKEFFANEPNATLVINGSALVKLPRHNFNWCWNLFYALICLLLLLVVGYLFQPFSVMAIMDSTPPSFHFAFDPQAHGGSGSGSG